MKNIKIIEINSELGCSQLGASMGSDAIKIAAHKNHSDFFSRHEIIKLPERNQLLSKKGKNPGHEKVKWLKYILENCQTACNTVSDVLEDNHFPVVLSADHSSAIGVIAGVKQVYPEERLGIIWIDAHSDLHSPYTTHSGNMHGMPLGATLALDQQARKLINEVPNSLPIATQIQWNHLKELGGVAPKVLPQDLILIGVRYFKPEHSVLIDELNIKLYDVDALRNQDINSFVQTINILLDQCDKIYVSFDVDSLDCDEVSRGTGTPEPNGLYLNEAVELIKCLMKNSKICCLEISEVNPVLDDKGNSMGEAAWKILEAAVEN